ncbi:MAG: TIGR03086 family metal-binding protein [Acidimicrobiales bacterium]
MDVVDLDRRAVNATAEVLAATTDDQYTAPTPCGQWSVRDLVSHLLAGNVKYARVAGGGDWVEGAPEVDLGDDPLGTYRQSAEALLQAWRKPGTLDRQIHMPWGPDRVEAAAYLHVGDTLVHGWDLAKATGRTLDADADVVEVSLAKYATWLPPQRPEGFPFDDARHIDDDAPPIDRLAAFLGRDVGAWSA